MFFTNLLTIININFSRKRTDNLCCEDYFMAVAILATERCDDTPRIGACVINKDNKVIGIGYNRKLSEKGRILCII